MAAPMPALPQHLNIVALETFFTPLPALRLPAPYTFSLTTYERTRPEQAAERLRDADIAIITVLPLTAATLGADQTPRLRLVAAMASGTDSIDLAACRDRGIRVLNSPNCNTAALAEHVAAMYLGLRRSLLPVQRSLCAGDWARTGSIMTACYNGGRPPRSCADETVGIVGYGGVGKAVGAVLGALGMKIVVSGRRGDRDAETLAAQGRVPFETVLQTASVLVVCCPRLPETMGLIGAAELALMQPDALLVNVSRGGIVGEAATVDALRRGLIAGAATDVFDVEPASPETSVVVAAAAAGDLNLIVTAHTAWVAGSTRANYQRVVQENVYGFVAGDMAPERVKA